jgi:nanoRNase/pAp phosphatase (c-di-AMP/oligoRNAs hydrolase)
MSKTNPEYSSSVDQALLNRLRNAAGIGPLLILTHDSPDPDALASGKGLAYLFKEAWNISSELVYSGLVARAENRMVLNMLTPEWRHAEGLPDIARYSSIVLVDTQPAAGNNRLPVNITPQIVIDHHRPLWDALQAVRYVDVRPELGATVSLVYQYLEAAQLIPDATLATAMFYGLQTDTRGLARDASHTDEAVYMKLVGSIDRQKLAMVEQAGLSRDYFKAFNRGLEAARVYGSCVFANLGIVHRPDLPAEMADVLIRLESARAALCLGVYGDQVHLSLRTEPSGQDAGQLMQKIIDNRGKAGGHGSIAGGQISIFDKDADQLADEIEKRFLSIMQEDEKGRPLL